MMKKISRFALTGVAAALPVLLFGCSAGTPSTLPNPSLPQPGSDSKGGSDSGRSASEQAKVDETALKAPRVGIFLSGLTSAKTPSPYTHIWATILKVELLDDKDGAQTVWDGGTEGMTVDLTTLAGDGTSLAGVATNRFLALAAAPVGAAKATQRVRVTFGKALELFHAGTATGDTTLLSDTMPHDSEGRPVASYALSKPRDLSSGRDNIVVEFDLAKLVVKDGKASPALSDGDTAGLKDLTRQDVATFLGTVSGMSGSAPETKFVLTADTSGIPTAVVETTGATALYNDDAAPNPALADKKRIAVTGILAPDTKRITAAEISAFTSDKPAVGGSVVSGSVSHVSGADKTFVVEAQSVAGLDPTLGVITVAVAPDAVLRSRGGLLLTGDEFWAALTAKGAAPIARVSGTYDPVTGTLTAKRAKFETLSPTTAHEADVQGEPKLVDIGAQTLLVSSPLVQWEGIAAPGDKSKGIPVTITSATAFRDESGTSVASPKFFDAALAAKAKGEIVHVVGLYSKGALTATRIELIPAPAAPTSSSSQTAAAPSPGASQAAATAAAINGAASAVTAAAGNASLPTNLKAAMTPATVPSPPGATPTPK